MIRHDWDWHRLLDKILLITIAILLPFYFVPLPQATLIYEQLFIFASGSWITLAWHKWMKMSPFTQHLVCSWLSENDCLGLQRRLSAFSTNVQNRGRRESENLELKKLKNEISNKKAIFSGWILLNHHHRVHRMAWSRGMVKYCGASLSQHHECPLKLCSWRIPMTPKKSYL